MTFLLLFATLLNAAEITGVVTDESHAVIADLKVRLFEAGRRTPIAATRTDETGRFHFAVDDGVYDLTVGGSFPVNPPYGLQDDLLDLKPGTLLGGFIPKRVPDLKVASGETITVPPVRLGVMDPCFNWEAMPVTLLTIDPAPAKATSPTPKQSPQTPTNSATHPKPGKTPTPPPPSTGK